AGSQVPELIALYEKVPPGQEEERAQALSALSECGKAARPALPLVVRVLQDKEPPRLQWYALDIIEHIGPAARDAVPVLLPYLDDEGYVAKSEVIKALAMIGPSASAALPLLEKLTKDHDRFTRDEAKQALKAVRKK